MLAVRGTTMTGGRERLVARLSFRVGVLAGAGAYLCGYLLIYLLTVSRVRSELSRLDVDATLSLFGGGGIAPWKVTGWFFYGAHFVDVSVTSSAMDLSTDVIEVSAGDWRTLLFFVPPVAPAGRWRARSPPCRCEAGFGRRRGGVDGAARIFRTRVRRCLPHPD
jgi:hypothetical protein